MTGRARGEPAWFEPPHPAYGPNGSRVKKSTRTYTAKLVPYPVPAGYERQGEWSCVVECWDGTRADGEWVGTRWAWRSETRP